ncbi:MAG: DUF362 domain-containing protein [Anaerolineae bacterium]
MENPRAALVRCTNYELEQVEAALRKSLSLLGGIERFVKPGQKVILKVNLLRAVAPESAATTHPAVVAMVAKLVHEAGAQPIVLDSPGGPFKPALLQLYYRKTGMILAEQYGAELNLNTETTQVAHPEGVVLHRLDIVKRILDADVVINLPKLKTHNLTTLTMAVKNLFGVVPGVLKLSYHAKMQDRSLFSSGMVDILTFVKPNLNILDAVVAMEGNGPSGGNPRQVGALIVSEDAFALDITGASLVGINPLSVLTTLEGVKRGLCTGTLQDIEVVGDDLDQLRVSNFKRGIVAMMDPGLLPKRLQTAVDGSARQQPRSTLSKITQGWVARQLLVTPQAGPACTGCGDCARHCPVKAVELVNGKAHMNANTCMRCYCCHELCPELAIELKRPWLGRLFIGRS